MEGWLTKQGTTGWRRQYFVVQDGMLTCIDLRGPPAHEQALPAKQVGTLMEGSTLHDDPERVGGLTFSFRFDVDGTKFAADTEDMKVKFLQSLTQSKPVEGWLAQYVGDKWVSRFVATHSRSLRAYAADPAQKSSLPLASCIVTAAATQGPTWPNDLDGPLIGNSSAEISPDARDYRGRFSIVSPRAIWQLAAPDETTLNAWVAYLQQAVKDEKLNTRMRLLKQHNGVLPLDGAAMSPTSPATPPSPLAPQRTPRTPSSPSAPNGEDIPYSPRNALDEGPAARDLVEDTLFRHLSDRPSQESLKQRNILKDDTGVANASNMSAARMRLAHAQRMDALNKKLYTRPSVEDMMKKDYFKT